VGKRLRSEAAVNGRTLKEGHPKFARPGLQKLKGKLGEDPKQNWPSEWDSTPMLPERHRP
jgi:hydroxymethylglutaryl-CoA lyase